MITNQLRDPKVLKKKQGINRSQEDKETLLECDVFVPI